MQHIVSKLRAPFALEFSDVGSIDARAGIAIVKGVLSRGDINIFDLLPKNDEARIENVPTTGCVNKYTVPRDVNRMTTSRAQHYLSNECVVTFNTGKVKVLWVVGVGGGVATGDTLGRSLLHPTEGMYGYI